MFERYTEQARRVIFLARFEAGHSGAEMIGTEHLLLGITEQDQGQLMSVVGAMATEEEIRRRLNLKPEGASKATSVDMPLSNPSKRVLAYAAEEAERLGHKLISAAHLLLGLMREQGCEAERVLQELGADLTQLRERFSQERTLVYPEPSETATDLPYRMLLAQHGELAEGERPRIGFDRYTEKARRAIFFARHEVSHLGGESIESEHLLLGMWREGAGLISDLMGRQDKWPELRKRIEAHSPQPRKKVSTSVDMPLSEEAKQALEGAAEEMEMRKGKQVGVDDLLLGLLRVEGCFAAQLLRERGADVEEIRRRRDEKGRGTEGQRDQS